MSFIWIFNTNTYAQGCNAVALMLGYTNPWAILIRKQCEAVPIAVQGVYDMAMSLLVDVPFAKCICVDAAAHGSNFERYAKVSVSCCWEIPVMQR